MNKMQDASFMDKKTATIKEDVATTYLSKLGLSFKKIEDLSTRTDMLRKFEESYPGYLENELDVPGDIYSDSQKNIVLSENVKTKVNRNTFNKISRGENVELQRIAMLKVIVEHQLNTKIDDANFIECSNSPNIKVKNSDDNKLAVENKVEKGVINNIDELSGTLNQTLNFGSED